MNELSAELSGELSSELSKELSGKLSDELFREPCSEFSRLILRIQEDEIPPVALRYDISAVDTRKASKPLDRGESRPILSAMPLCRDVELLRPFIEKNRPATNSIANLVYNTLGSRLRWVRADDIRDPHAVLCRTHRFTLYADSGPAAARVLAEVPRNMRMVFSATPTRFCRMIRKSWHGPDAGRRAWYNHCYLYVLKPGRLVINRTHHVSRLRPGDAPLIARSWPYGRSTDHILRRILNGPGCCIRRKGEPVAWGLTHDDGSMGFLHVLKAYRGQGMARALTTALARRLLRIGIQPFMHIVTGNSASIRLTASMGFTRAGRFSWFGTN